MYAVDPNKVFGDGGDTFAAMTPEMQVTVWLAMFSPGISEKALTNACCVVLETACVTNLNPLTVALDLIRLRDENESERARLMPDPKLREMLAGFFSHPHPPMAEVMDAVAAIKARGETALDEPMVHAGIDALCSALAESARMANP